ncbi:MAG: DUF1549 domain-containing protein [Verrucomicrobiales bacterium]|nr:DUF1549 domain-containing protein [Verrucomicrobiales bacterium]
MPSFSWMGQKANFSAGRFGLNFVLLLLAFAGCGFLMNALFKKPNISAVPPPSVNIPSQTLDELNSSFSSEWANKKVSPSPPADNYTLARRLSLSLTGAVPSLEELRKLESTPDIDQLNAWLNHLLTDRRYAHYLAERFARVYVGVEQGPFLVYRRRRMVNWIADQLAVNRPYDKMARELIASKGIWTTSPAANFITVTNGQGKMGPDEVKLAARTSRAFLGVSLDCVQCHDDKFGDRWKQKDFHQLAAFFAQSEVGVNGVWDNSSRDYETRFKGQKEAEKVSMEVPFQKAVFRENGSAREQLADWITHRENRSFSRAVANRAWAVLFGRPLVTPIDDIPIDGPVPAQLDILADAFVESGYDLQSLFRLIANSEPFLRDSKSDDPEKPVTETQEASWAAYPLTQLRPEQVAGSVIQAASIRALDSSSHIVKRFQRFNETKDFVKRYGDKGESEFSEGTGTIPQRLILMNGNLVKDRTEPNPFLNATTRIAALTKDPDRAIESAFLAVLTRLPTDPELSYFRQRIGDKKGDNRQKAFHDLYWALINSTEFSWNR